MTQTSCLFTEVLMKVKRVLTHVFCFNRKLQQTEAVAGALNRKLQSDDLLTPPPKKI